MDKKSIESFRKYIKIPDKEEIANMKEIHKRKQKDRKKASKKEKGGR